MARGADIFTQDPLVTLKKSYFFRRQGPNLSENELNGFSDSNHGVIITRSVATINACSNSGAVQGSMFQGSTLNPLRTLNIELYT